MTVFPSKPIVLCLAWAVWLSAAAQPAPGSVQLETRFTPRTDGSGLGELEIDLRDAATRQPLDFPARRLAAWLQKPLPTLAEGEISCTDKVRMLASPGLGRRAVVDFNTHRLLAVNSDSSLTFINPFLRLNQAKLEDVITLPGAAHAVLHRPQAHEVWLALAGTDQVLVIDTDARRIRHTHALAAGNQPVALTEAGGAVWVAQAGRDEWLRFAGGDAAPKAVAAPRAQAWLAVPGADTPLGLGASGVIRLGPATAQTLPTGTVLQAVWSPLAQRALAVQAGGGLLWLDAQGLPAQRLPTGPVMRLAMFDHGRYALAALSDHLLVIDMATAAVLQKVALQAPVTDIGFSANFAYLHSPGAARATLLALADLRQGRSRPVQVAMGAVAAGDAANALRSIEPAGTAHRLQHLPEGTGMYVASPHDGQIYQYAEGMMAPIGSFSNYRRSPLALLLLDDGLRQSAPGRYRAVMRAPRGGSYELVISGVQPRFADCSELQLPMVAQASPPPGEAVAVRARLLGTPQASDAGNLRVRVQLDGGADTQLVNGVNDLELLAFDKRSGWQARRRMRHVGPGVYEAVLETPSTGALDLRVSSASRDLPFHAGALGTVALGAQP